MRCVTRPGAAVVTTRRTDSAHTRRGKLRPDRGFARARHDVARGIANGLAVTEREPRIARAERGDDRDADDLGVSTAVDISAPIAIGLRIGVADRLGERDTEWIGIAQPALIADGLDLTGPDRESEPDSEPLRLARAGQG